MVKLSIGCPFPDHCVDRDKLKDWYFGGDENRRCYVTALGKLAESSGVHGHIFDTTFKCHDPVKGYAYGTPDIGRVLSLTGYIITFFGD